MSDWTPKTDPDENPYAAPLSTLLDDSHNRAVYRYKSSVVFSPKTELPPRCIRCNEPTEQSRKQRISYINPFWLLLIFLNILIFMLVAVIVSKRFKLNLPMCEKHLRRYRQILVAALLLLLSSITLFSLTVVPGAVPESWRGAGMLAALCLFLLALVCAIVNRLVVITKMKNGQIWLRGCRRPFLDSLPELER